MSKNRYIRAITILLIVLCLAFSAGIFKAFLDGKFSSVETLRDYIAGYGYMAPIILIWIQALQVVVPILPGFLGCAVGAVLFGCAGGFICNYVGISIGSMIAFLLAKRLGAGFVHSLFPEDKYEKWSNWAAKSKSYAGFLFAAMVLPLFPDDFFCYFSGLTKMSFRRFAIIIILGKPWCILAYSFGFSLIK